MFNWASNIERGNLLPEGFRNPSDKAARMQRSTANYPFGEPNVTMSMPVVFISRCDAFQLPRFATLILCGLRVCYFESNLMANGLRSIACLNSIT